MKLLFIGSRLYDDVDFYIRKKGITSLLTESNENAVNLDLPDRVFIVPRGMDEPMRIAVEENVDAVVPLIGIDPPLIDVAVMKEKLEGDWGIPVIASDVRAVNLTSDKTQTKEFFTEIGVNTPNYQILTDSDELKLDFPVVLKQGAGQGGKDIKIAKDIGEVEAYLKEFGQALCEEFIDGAEISIEVLGFRGQYVPLTPIYKGETTLEGVHPLNKVKYGPCDVEGLNNDLVCENALKIASELNSDGIFEMDFMFSKSNGKLYAIEVNTRPNGTRYLTTATCGVNSLLSLVDMACGEFDGHKIRARIENNFSTEIPVGDYKGVRPQEPVKSFEKNDFVVHGPEGYERITISAKSRKALEERRDELLANK